jgi:predicted nucleotidyltransferase
MRARMLGAFWQAGPHHRPAMAASVDDRKIGDFCRRWNISDLALFGSALREDFRPDSDVDVLIRVGPGAGHSVFDLVRMQEELTSILGRQVDLVERAAVERSENYIRRKHILESLRPIHVA